MSQEETTAFITGVKQLLEPIESTLQNILTTIAPLQEASHTSEACPNTFEIATIKEKLRKDEERETKTVDKSRSVLWDIAKILITALSSMVAAYVMLRLGLK